MAVSGARLLVFLAFLWVSAVLVECRVRHYKFNVVMRNYTRLCSRKPIVTVNGRFPGPTLYAREDDTVLVKLGKLKRNVGQWWKSNTEVINEAMKSGLAPNVSDAHTINGGRGIIYNPNTDPKKINLVDPVERNTVGVPSGGWTAIRFRAHNPGVWFMHCHLEVHTTWGLKVAILVENGKGPNESMSWKARRVFEVGDFNLVNKKDGESL